ncbi:MAG: T9SS type A sorting domain-containing protein [Bacteroidota bacterium]
MKQILSILFVCLLFSTSSFGQGVCEVPVDLNSEVRPNGRAAVLSWRNDFPPDTFVFPGVDGEAAGLRYRVQVFDSEGSRIFNGVFNDTILVVRGLSRGEAYGWRVRTLCGDGNNSAYANSSFTTSVSCNDPANLTSQVRPNGRAVRLRWNSSSANARYRVRVFDSNNERIFNGVFRDTILVVRGLIPGESYTWGVQGSCGGGQNTDVVTSSFTTGTVAASCETPVKLTSNVRPNGRSAMLSWSRSLDHITDTILLTNLRYSVQVFNSSQERIFNGVFNDTMMVVRGLVPGQSYTWGVRASCGGGDVSGVAQAAFSTQRSASTSSVSGGLIAFPNPSAQNKVTLSWDASTFATGNILSTPSADTETGKVSIAVLDYTGKALYQTQLESSQNQIELDVSTVAAGLYFIQLTAENGQKAAIKFVKE